jgi:hypothetical protein
MIQPDGLTFGPPSATGITLYVADSGDDNVVAVANATTSSPSQSAYINGTSAGIESPTGLTWGPNGDLYITDAGRTAPGYQGNIFQYDPIATTISAITPSSGAGDLAGQFPSTVFFDNQGNMLTADVGSNGPPTLDGSINQYTASGAFIQTLVSSSAFPDTGGGTSGISPSQMLLLPLPQITSNPPNPMCGVGGTTTLTAGASSSLGSPVVQWQVSTNGGKTFTDVTDGGVYSGATTPTLTITGATSAMSGYEYQAVFTNAADLATTTAAGTLTVQYQSQWAASAYSYSYAAYVYAFDAYVTGAGSYTAFYEEYFAYVYSQLANSYASAGNAAMTQFYAYYAYYYGYLGQYYAYADYAQSGGASVYSYDAYLDGYYGQYYSYYTAIGQ